ncbi:MAG TPA: DUF2970 domain-containing protein [Methylococcaceae bacterium]|nr:DUF2970 domain-containing protein [Methylococcaceae bacterium]
MTPPSSGPENRPESSPTLLQIVGSALAAAFGVQSSRNLSRDFHHSSPWVYVAVGITLTILFVLAIKGLVGLAMSR